jgi:hypothetical protein
LIKILRKRAGNLWNVEAIRVHIKKCARAPYIKCEVKPVEVEQTKIWFEYLK